MSTVKGFKAFVDRSTDPTSFCLAERERFLHLGYVEIKENNFPAELPKKAFLIRNERTLLAYNIGGYKSAIICAAHNDSPIMKLAPNYELNSPLYHVLKQANYAGGLSATWMGRDLRLVGTVTYKNENGEFCRKHIDSKKPIAFVPFEEVIYNPKAALSPVINRDVNLNPICGAVGGPTLAEYISKLTDIPVDKILHTELYMIDNHDAGIYGDFLSSGRLDNLVSTYACINGFCLAEPKDTINMLAIFDNEETGSRSFAGAFCDVIEKTLKYICRCSGTDYCALKANSLFVSADACHANHPNYPGLAEKNHAQFAGHGVVVKGLGQNSTSQNKRGQLVVVSAAVKANKMLVIGNKRNTSGGGGTIGPKVEAMLGIQTVDMGAAMWAMHSLRETMASEDIKRHVSIILYVYSCYEEIRAQADSEEIVLEVPLSAEED